MTQTEYTVIRGCHQMFAGQALSMLAQAAFTAASRHARSNVVLAGVDDLRFTAPVPVGSLFIMAARVISAGRSSMVVEVIASHEDPQTGARAPVAQGHDHRRLRRDGL